MPQRIPVEASETETFTPECLAEIDNPPVFTLRAATTREKRFMRDLLREEGIKQYSLEQLREELLNGLRDAWDEETCAEKVPILEAYWASLDEFALQKRDNPELEWSYDSAVEHAVQQLESDVQQGWRPLARMLAANARTDELSSLAMVAAVTKTWTGLTLRPKRERGYLTIDGADELREALVLIDDASGVETGRSWRQLIVACSRRMFLEKDTEGNSDAGSPSEATPPTSKAKAHGKSPASAPSSETPASA